MVGRLDAPEGNRGRRICYSCGNSYPTVFRFCPIDSTDLEYLPQPIENLARDFKRPKAKLWVAVSIGTAIVLALAAWMLTARPGMVLAGGGSAYGELTVRTTPAGAAVYLDGSQVGVSPVRLSDAGRR